MVVGLVEATLDTVTRFTPHNEMMHAVERLTQNRVIGPAEWLRVQPGLWQLGLYQLTEGLTLLRVAVMHGQGLPDGVNASGEAAQPQRCRGIERRDQPRHQTIP